MNVRTRAMRAASLCLLLAFLLTDMPAALAQCKACFVTSTQPATNAAQAASMCPAVCASLKFNGRLDSNAAFDGLIWCGFKSELAHTLFNTYPVVVNKGMLPDKAAWQVCKERIPLVRYLNSPPQPAGRSPADSAVWDGNPRQFQCGCS